MDRATASGAIAAVVVDAIGNTPGFDRVYMIETRLVGSKSREVHEVAGAQTLARRLRPGPRARAAHARRSDAGGAPRC